MAAKTFNTRFQLKYDKYENWNDLDKQFPLLAGEIAIAEIPNDDPEQPSVILFKVGNGNKTFRELPLVSAIGADVPSWAKQIKRSDNKTLIAEDAFIKALDDIETLKAFFNGDNQGQAVNVLDKLLELEELAESNSEQLATITPIVEDNTEQITGIKEQLMPKQDIIDALNAYGVELSTLTGRVNTFLDSKELNETIDTLYEIQNWISGDGVDTTDLTEAIAKESELREQLTEEFNTLKNNVVLQKDFSDGITGILEAAAGVAQEKANAAKTEAINTSKEYTDQEITNLATVAKTGKISDLNQSENAWDYVIFNCGTAELLVKDPSTITYNPPSEEPTE